MIFDGKTEPECLRAITDAHTQDGTDASDTGGLPNGGVPKASAKDDKGALRSFEGMKDEDFWSGLETPVQYAF